MNELRVLDYLVENYFGQDYDVIDDSNEIGPIIEAYTRHSSKSIQIALFEDIEGVLAQGEQLNVIFKDRYSSYFLSKKKYL
ncbi:contact-dependent growth inhibition system immunity protein [Enterobacter soli]|uniref:contact-dependent growth inhibition system immunity protein n=1 Tax=Enterobacter soli TaxID=885040 RepID=UPI003ED9B385